LKYCTNSSIEICDKEYHTKATPSNSGIKTLATVFALLFNELF
jgi:hypothetical protein